MISFWKRKRHWIRKKDAWRKPIYEIYQPINFTFTTNILNQYKSGKSTSMRSLNYSEDQDINYINLPRILFSKSIFKAPLFAFITGNVAILSTEYQFPSFFNLSTTNYYYFWDNLRSRFEIIFCSTELQYDEFPIKGFNYRVVIITSIYYSFFKILQILAWI